ncbi:Gamma interferon inducible lysosomal thiol reductase GILT [Cladophialophora carrionii]|uniref:Gamma interferon inducible lysosomal thiol reductase GILT n=1 Tax=Cladophialophora carrionii TaxID=86049 RepID=A0A1C1C7M4_9EURO|nr:Gamma interferon inducible lysosomal thiol reductase GILT [Cladophialophora carrionii]
MGSQTPPFDEKQQHLLHEPFATETDLPPIDNYSPRRYHQQHIFKRVIPVFLTLLAIFYLLPTTFVCQHHNDPALSSRPVAVEEKVPLEIHVMSKCPDARDCLRELIVPTMVKVSEKVNLTMSFIGSIDPNSDAVSCKHGPGECLGNIILLCAAKVYPDVKLWLGYANCLISDYPDIPKRDLVESCAMEHALDFQKLNSCISDEGEGIDLLRASIERSQENNVTKSCTVRLAGEIRCIRDGGEWYDCPGGSSVDDLVGDINKLYSASL